MSEKPTTPDLFRSAPWWKPVGFREAALTTEERKVYDVVRFHPGAATAIKQDDIAAMTGLSNRQVQEILKHLTEFHGLLLASSVKPPYGVYIPDSADELLNYTRQLRRRAISQLVRLSKLERTHLDDLLGQLRVEIEQQGESK